MESREEGNAGEVFLSNLDSGERRGDSYKQRLAQFLAHSRCLVSGGGVYNSIASISFYLPGSLPSSSIRPVVSEDAGVPTSTLFLSNSPFLPSLGPVGTQLGSPHFPSTPRTRSRAHICGQTGDTSPRVDLWAPDPGVEVGEAGALTAVPKTEAQRSRAVPQPLTLGGA